jgi:hypothetical protein
VRWKCVPCRATFCILFFFIFGNGVIQKALPFVKWKRPLYLLFVLKIVSNTWKWLATCCIWAVDGRLGCCHETEEVAGVSIQDDDKTIFFNGTGSKETRF